MLVVYIILFFAFAALSHGAFLFFARHHQNYSTEKKLRLWLLHTWLNGTLWLMLASFVGTAQFLFLRFNPTPQVQFLGLVSLVIGCFFVARSHLALGFKQAMGLRFFFPKKTKKITAGLYRFLNNPMYDGFLFILIGLGLTLGIVEDFYLAIASFILLNIFFASVENYTLKLNPF